MQADGTPGGHRHGLELVPAGGVPVRAGQLVEPGRRDPRGHPRQRGHGRRGRAPARADGPRAAHRRRVLLLPARRRGSSGSTPWPPAPSATPPTATSCWPRSASGPGCEVRVISGAEEAWYGYLAIANSTTLDGRLRDRHRRRQRADHAHRGPPAARGGVGAPGRGARERGLPARTRRPPRSRSRRCASTWRARSTEFEWWQARRAPRLAGLGGTIRNLAAAAQKRLELPDLDVQGFVLTRDALEELIEQLASSGPRRSAARCAASSPTAAT